MTQTTARIKQNNKHFEIIVDMELALKYKKGESKVVDFLEMDRIFTDAKKGMAASEAEIENAFKTTDVYEIAGKIVKNGEVLVSQDYRDEEREKKIKQVVDFLARNAFDPRTGNPHTPDRIKTALEQAHVNIKNTSIDSQLPEIMEALSKILPIRIATKKIKIVIPAVHTGRAYGAVTQYKIEENWLGNGDLEVVVEVPAGMIMDFYEKLNSVTHGSALTEEIKE